MFHHVIEESRELLEDPWVARHCLSVTRERSDLRRITTTGPALRLSRTPVDVGRPAPKPGSDTREILQEIGLCNQFGCFVEKGVIRVEGIVPG